MTTWAGTTRGSLFLMTASLAAMVGLSACRDGPQSTIENVLDTHPEVLRALPDTPEKHRVQIALAEVVQQDGRATVKRSTYRAGAEYFYPASTIKLGAAIVAVQVIEELERARRAAGGAAGDDGVAITIDSTLRIHPLFAGEVVRERDDSNVPSGHITVRHEIRKLFLVSDNEAFNRLYDLVGHEDLNRRLRGLGLSSTVINHRLSVGRSPQENRLTPRIDILDARGGVIHTIPERRSELSLSTTNLLGLKVGKGYRRGDSEIVLEPMDFSARNAMSLTDLQDLLILLARPDIDIGKGPLKLSNEHRRFLLETMRELPGDSPNPRYDRASYPDEWGKFFLPGLRRVPAAARASIANKVGQAYGFTIDNACVAEPGPDGRWFFLAATIYTNADEVLNDDAYEYDAVAFPFMAALGEAVARELWQGATPASPDQ